MRKLPMYIINQFQKQEGEEENKDEPKQIPDSKWQTRKDINIIRVAKEESTAAEREY